MILEQAGLTPRAAALTFSYGAFAAIVAILLFGRLIDRFGPRTTVIPALLTVASELWAATYILMGARYPDMLTRALFQGVLPMLEDFSSTYQAAQRTLKIAGKPVRVLKQVCELLFTDPLAASRQIGLPICFNLTQDRMARDIQSHHAILLDEREKQGPPHSET